jgi:hypothetical protein
MKHFYYRNDLSTLAMVYQLAQQMMQTNRVACSASSIHLNHLPFEILETILIKATGQLFLVIHRMTTRAEVYTRLTISAVSLLWWRTLTNRQYNKRILKQQFRYVCRPFKCNPQHLTSLQVEGGRNVRGVAEFNSKLYVACGVSNTIQVYSNRPPFSRLEDIKVQELKDPSDIVVCSQTSQLYITDDEQCVIWRVNLLSTKQVDKFITIQWQPLTLSVNSSRLLITPRDGDSLFVYGEDGSQLNHIKLPHYM